MNQSRVLPVVALVVIATGVIAYLGDRRGSDAVDPANGTLVVVAPIPLTPAESGEVPTLPTGPAAFPEPGEQVEPSALEVLLSRESELRVRSQQLEQDWAADTYDPATSPGIEDSLVTALAAERIVQVRDQPARISGIDCRRSKCRIEAVFPAGRSGTEWGTRLLMELGGTFNGSEMILLPGAEGETNLVIYADRARSGSS